MRPCFRINTHIGASKLNKPLKLTILPQGVVCREVLKHNIFHVFDLSCQSPASFTVKLHHYSLRSWINRQAGRHKDRQACPAGDFPLHNSNWEGGVLWKANLDIITSLLNISFAAIRGADTLLSQLLFLCHLHDTARWLLKTKKKWPVLFRDDVRVGGCAVCQVETRLVEFRLIAICPLSTCLNTHTHVAVDEFPALCLGCITNAYVVFGVAQSSFHMEMWCDESRLRPATAYLVQHYTRSCPLCP